MVDVWTSCVRFREVRSRVVPNYAHGPTWQHLHRRRQTTHMVLRGKNYVATSIYAHGPTWQLRRRETTILCTVDGGGIVEEVHLSFSHSQISVCESDALARDSRDSLMRDSSPASRDSLMRDSMALAGPPDEEPVRLPSRGTNGADAPAAPRVSYGISVAGTRNSSTASAAGTSAGVVPGTASASAAGTSAGVPGIVGTK